MGTRQHACTHNVVSRVIVRNSMFFEKNMIGDGVNLCLMMNERNLVAKKAMEE